MDLFCHDNTPLEVPNPGIIYIFYASLADTVKLGFILFARNRKLLVFLVALTSFGNHHCGGPANTPPWRWRGG